MVHHHHGRRRQSRLFNLILLNGEPLLAESLSVLAGIADNSYTEILEGLQEDDLVIIGSTAPPDASAARMPGASPFGGGFRGGGPGGGRPPR